MSDLLAQPVGRFGIAAGAKGSLVQALNGSSIGLSLRQNGKRQVGHGRLKKWACLWLAAQERRNLRIRPEQGQLLLRGKLRLIAGGVHHAEEAERLSCSSAKLMPSHGRNRDEITQLDLFHFVSHETMAATAQHQHGMHMRV